MGSGCHGARCTPRPCRLSYLARLLIYDRRWTCRSRHCSHQITRAFASSGNSAIEKERERERETWAKRGQIVTIRLTVFCVHLHSLILDQQLRFSSRQFSRPIVGRAGKAEVTSRTNLKLILLRFDYSLIRSDEGWELNQRKKDQNMILTRS
jgi:hypothetical protein